MKTDNELVAEFMGLAHQLHLWECPITGNYIPEEELQYHCNWSWIMPVVEKVEKQGFTVTIEMELCIIEGNIADYYKQTYDGSKIKAVYNAVLTFIKWYNQNK